MTRWTLDIRADALRCDSRGDVIKGILLRLTAGQMQDAEKASMTLAVAPRSLQADRDGRVDIHSVDFMYTSTIGNSHYDVKSCYIIECV